MRNKSLYTISQSFPTLKETRVTDSLLACLFLDVEASNISIRAPQFYHGFILKVEIAFLLVMSQLEQMDFPSYSL